MDTYNGRFYNKITIGTGVRCYTSGSRQIQQDGSLCATTEKTSAGGLAKLFRDHVWKLHGLPESIISDRGPQFAAGLMKELNAMLGIQTKLSTAFHPQTDGQTERMNQELEQYLRMFIDHCQEQWPGLARYS
jgi:Integrase core domain.